MNPSEPIASRSAQLARGLATLALLKANFDSGTDHIDMLVPFVLDCIAAHSTDDFKADDIRTTLLDRHGLQIPSASIQVILTRVSRRHNSIRREGGRYFRVPGIRSAVPDIPNATRMIQSEHLVIAGTLRKFATTNKVPVATDDDALALLFDFLAQYHVLLLLESPSEDSGAPVLQNLVKGLGSREMRTVARFILERCLPDSQLRGTLERMLEGFVLQNALLLKDITTATRKFSNLTVFFDTGFLLQALGLTGEAAALAARESLDLLRVTNASLAVFRITINEIKRILSVYERHLGSADGIAALRPTPLTRYMVTHHFSPSDVRENIALLEKQVRGLGVTIKEIPTHDQRYTLGEPDLSRRLRKADESDLEPRVVHDVNCVAAILTLRAGHVSNSYDTAGAVFATTSGLVVKDVREWYREQGESGVPPIIHQLALSNIAWLKKPAAATNLKLHELVALCSAALGPSTRTWQLFLRHLRKLRDSQQLTSDEMVAIIATEIIDSLLTQFDDEVEPDATTLTEVVERVKATYQSETMARIAKVERKASEEVASALIETAKTKVDLRKKEEEHRNLVLNLRGKAATIARIVGWAFFVVIALILVIGPPVIGYNLIPIGTTLAGVVAYVVTGTVWLAAVLGLLWGGHVDQWRRVVEVRVDRSLRKWFGITETLKTPE